jgi:hypothetical protein
VLASSLGIGVRPLKLKAYALGAVPCGIAGVLFDDDDETALVVLHRPGTASVSDTDQRIFRVLCGAVARRDTAPWAFYVATPHGVHEMVAPQVTKACIIAS